MRALTDPALAPKRAVVKTIAPGQPGAIQWGRRFGDALVCVRYRAESGGMVRLTTVELIVDAMPIQPRKRRDPLVLVEGSLRDRATRNQAIRQGAVWDQKEQAWRMPLSLLRKLGLHSRQY